MNFQRWTENIRSFELIQQVSIAFVDETRKMMLQPNKRYRVDARKASGPARGPLNDVCPRNLRVKIFMKYTPGSERTLDLGDVAVFKTARSAARPAVTRAAEVVVKVLIQSPQDITVGSCRII